MQDWKDDLILQHSRISMYAAKGSICPRACYTHPAPRLTIELQEDPIFAMLQALNAAR